MTDHHVRTNVGRWLQAALLGRSKLRDRLRLNLNNGDPAHVNPNEAEVMTAACEMFVKQYLGSTYSPGAVRAFTYELDEMMHLPGTTDEYNVTREDIDRAIRAALRSGRPLPGEDSHKSIYMMGMIMVYVVTMKSIDSDDIERNIVHAEDMAFDRGWSPSLIDT